MVLPLPTSPCNSRFIGYRAFRSIDDSSTRASARPRDEWKDRFDALPDSIALFRIEHLFRVRLWTPAERKDQLEQEELLEDEPSMIRAIAAGSVV